LSHVGLQRHANGAVSKGMLIGERADLKLQEAAFAIAKTTADVACPNGLVSVHFAPD